MFIPTQNRFQLRAVATILLSLTAGTLFAAVGEFEASADVGKVELKGSAEFDAAKGQYKIAGSGENIWKTEDAFQFVYRKISGGSFALSMDVEWVGDGTEKHRKACAMVRQTLDADSPYVDVAVHGDGSIALQYRKTKGGITEATKSTVTAPASVKLERVGDVFTLSVAAKGEKFQAAGSVTLAMPDPVYAGLAVCSHNAKVSETAIFSNVSLKDAKATDAK